MEKLETAEEKFKRIASARTQKIIDMVNLLGNCSNTYTYEYTEEEVNKIFSTIEKELQINKDKFKIANSKKKGNKFTL